MAMTNQQQTEAYQFFAIAFGATPGVEYMNQLDEAYTFGLTTKEIVNIYTTKPAFNALYPAFFSSEQFANALIANVVGTSASDGAKDEARADIIAALGSGMTRGDIIYTVFTNLAAKNPADPTWGNTATMLANKVAVAKYATEVLLIQEADQDILDNVTANPTSVADAKQALVDNGAEPIASLKLTVGMDDLFGDGSSNIFKAVVGQNELGLQVNTLGSGDTIDGRGGVDTLMAKVTSGAFVGGSFSMPIQPETTSVEIVKIEAVLADVVPTDNATPRDEVFINAKDMTDVQQLWSNRSDADLTIMNMTTKGLAQLSDMTIGMAYTGSADSRWDASDMTVYFDQDYLIPEATRTNPVVDFLAMNEDAYDFTNGAFPLAGVFFRELQFTLNGTLHDLTPYLNEDPLGTGEEITTYTGFLAAMQAALVQLKADKPADAALATVTASIGQKFFTDVNPITLVQREGFGIRLTVDGITNGDNNTLTVLPTDLEVARAAASAVPNNNRYEIADSNPASDGSKLSINVALEKVGLAGDGGELIIGSMNKTSANVWDAVNTVVDGTTSGINEFNVIVYGANNKSSSLAGLHSTNNNLRVVTITTDPLQAATYADLTIGNSNTAGLSSLNFLNYDEALKDVQTFDASAFEGNLTLFAGLTDEIVDKYLNLEDAAPDAPNLDNLNFKYNGGVGNDNINLTISTNNGAFSGAATREDFLMNAAVDGGNGNDTITLALVDDSFVVAGDPQGLAYGTDTALASTFANWYDNQKLNANLRIDGGAGDDTIWTPGSGDVTIDGGIGDDTVYADNTGDKAVWAFNVADTTTPTISRYNLNNLQSSANDSYKIFKTDVKVSFLGFEATARIKDVNGVAKDLDINQAIKAAIQSNPVLNKLLVATDGPANTLVVTSLVDGTQVVTDLAVDLVAPLASAITAGEAGQLSTWYGTAGLTPTSAQAAIATVVTAFNTANTNVTGGTYNMGFARESGGNMDGGDSVHTSDNVITGGLGNDVLVLGTGRFSNDTVVYSGFGNGTDSIVNFVGASSVTTTVDYATYSYTQGAAGSPAVVTTVSEQATVEFTNATAPGTIVFNGVTITIVGTETAAQVAALVAAASGTYTDYTATNAPGTSTVVFTADAANAGTNLTDVKTTDFVVSGTTTTPSTSGVVLGVVSNIDGSTTTTTPAVTAQTEGFTVTFANAAAASSYTFDGESVPVLAGELGTDIAAAVATGNYANWTVTALTGNSVTFASTTPNANVADAAQFGGVAADLVTTTFGFTPGSDYLDFSAYNAEAVYVGGVLIAGGPTTALGQTYITLTESTTNDGSYTITQMVDAGTVGLTGDTAVGIIGVADFGIEQVFATQNFIL